MNMLGATGGQDVRAAEKTDRQNKMTLSRLRHDMRNHLNAIKLSCALLRRLPGEPMAQEAVGDIDHAADGILELVTRFMGDADAPGLLENDASPSRRH